MTYQNVLIAPFSTGLDSDLQPWLLPSEAFQELENFHIHHGVLEKRKGYQLFGYLVHRTETWQAGSQTISSITAAEPPVVTTSANHGLSNGDQVVITNSDMEAVNYRRFIVANQAGNTFQLTDSDGNNIDLRHLASPATTGVVYLSPDYPVMGFGFYYDNTGFRTLIAWNTKRACLWDATNSRFEPLDVTASQPFYDYMGGNSTGFVSSVTFRNQTTGSNRLYFSNNSQYTTVPNPNGGIMYYVGGASPPITAIQPDLVSGGSRKLQGAKFLGSSRGAIFAFNTIESGTRYPQRVRWCQNQNPDEWIDTVAGKGGYSDASSGESIVAGSNLLDSFLVFFTQSIFALNPNSNPALPVKWERKNSFQACAGVASKIEYDHEVITAGVRGLIGTSLTQSQRIDQRIQDFMRDSVNLKYADLMFGARNYIDERSWLLFPSGTDVASSTENDKALILDEESSAWSIYDISMNCLGQGVNFSDTDLLMSDFPDPDLVDADGNIINPRLLPVYFNEFDEDDTMQSFWLQSDQLPFISGDITGGVYQLENIDSDNGSSINALAKSANWNPFRAEGKNCEWATLKLFVSTHPNTQIFIDFFKNDEVLPWKTEKTDCKPDIRETALIADATAKSPPTDGVTIQAAGHGFSDNDQCYIYGVEGMEDINGGPWTVTVVNDNQFVIDVDATNFGTYTQFGIVSELPWNTEKVWKTVPVGSIARDHAIRIRCDGANRPLSIHGFMLKMRPVGEAIA